MKGIPTLGLKRLKRAAVLAGVGALVVGGSILGASQAHALTAIYGTQPGGVTLSPASGPLSTVPTYNSTACPTGFNGAADLIFIDPNTPGGLPKNQVPGDTLTNTNLSVAAPFSGQFQFPMSNVIPDLGDVSTTQPTVIEYAVFCYTAANGTGPGEWVQDTFVTFDPVAGTYSSSATPPTQTGPITPTVTLTASSPAHAGQNITLTATVSGTPTPAGTVAFAVGGTTIPGAEAVALNGSGVATFTTNTLPVGTAALTATYTSSDTTKWNSGEVGSLSLNVTPAPAFGGDIPLSVSVGNTGAFTLTVDTTTVVSLATSGSSAAGTTTPVVVNDTRNDYPGWSVSGLANPWTGTGAATGGSIPADNLGWAPGAAGTTLASSAVTLGPTVQPGTNFGDTAAVFASAPAGFNNGVNGDGTSTLTAGLNLNIPSVPAGAYSSTLSITGVDAAA